MTPERPETPGSAALTAEKRENGRTSEAGDGDKDRERERDPVETSGKRERDERSERESKREMREISRKKMRNGEHSVDVAMGGGQPATASSPVNNKVLRAGHEPQTNRAPCVNTSTCSKRQQLTLKEGRETHYYDALPTGGRQHEPLQTCQTGSNNAWPGLRSVTVDTSASFPQLQVSIHKRGEESALKTLPRALRLRSQ